MKKYEEVQQIESYKRTIHDWFIFWGIGSYTYDKLRLTLVQHLWDIFVVHWVTISYAAIIGKE